MRRLKVCETTTEAIDILHVVIKDTRQTSYKNRGILFFRIEIAVRLLI